MSKLRQQLQAAREQYQTARYPGDLVADVLRRQARRRRNWAIGMLPTAVAAAVAIAVILHRPAKTGQGIS